MNKSSLLTKIKTDLFGAGIIILFVFVIANSSLCTKAVLHGLSLSAGFLVPSLFFSMVLCGIIRELGILRQIPFINSRREVIILGLLGGYPVLSHLSEKSLKENKITKKEAELINNCFLSGGPAFVIGGIGAKLLGSPFLGVLIYISSIISSFILYLVLKKHKVSENKNEMGASDFCTALISSVESTAKSVINLSAFVTLFSAVAYILSNLSVSLKHISYFIEVTSAVSDIAFQKTSLLSLSLITFFQAFGCFSVQIQVLSNLKSIRLSKVRYLLYRLISSVISVVIMNIFFKLFPVSLSVSISFNKIPSFSSNLPASLFLILFAFFFIWYFERSKTKNYH